MMRYENKKGDILKLWIGVTKEEFLDNLKTHTYQYTLSNLFATNCFLSLIEEGRVYVCYTGKTFGAAGSRWFEADIEEVENGTIIKGKFVLTKTAKSIQLIMLLALWGGILWFIFPNLYLGIAVIPVGIIFTLFLKLMYRGSYEDEDNQRAIINFLSNLNNEQHHSQENGHNA